MAFLQIDYKSEALMRGVNIKVYACRGKRLP